VVSSEELAIPFLSEEKAYDHEHREDEYTRLKGMQEEIHHTDTREHATEDWIFCHKCYEEHDHNSKKENATENTSLDKLLDIPALWYIESVLLYHSACIHISHYVSISRTRARESLSEWMRLEAFDAGYRTLKVSLS
jgi:hypothetical protein